MSEKKLSEMSIEELEKEILRRKYLALLTGQNVNETTNDTKEIDRLIKEQQEKEEDKKAMKAFWGFFIFCGIIILIVVAWACGLSYPRA